MNYLAFLLKSAVITYGIFIAIFFMIGLVIMEGEGLVFAIPATLVVLAIYLIYRTVKKRTVKIHYVKRTTGKKRMDQIVKVSSMLISILAFSFLVYHAGEEQPDYFTSGLVFWIMPFLVNTAIYTFLRWK